MSAQSSVAEEAMTNFHSTKSGDIILLNKTALVFQDKLEELEAYIRTFKVENPALPI